MDYLSVFPTRLTKGLYFAVFIVGVITVLAFAPFNTYFLAWFSPALLFFALTKAKTRKEHLMLGWVYGLGLFGAGASWPFYSLYFFAKAHIVVALLGTFLFVAFVAFFSTGLFGLLASLFRHHSLLLRFLLFFPAAWVFAEWVRTWFLTGFPWLFLGNTQIDSIFSGIAPVTGVLGVSLMCAIFSGALLSFLMGDSLRTPVSHKASSRLEISEKTPSVKKYFDPSVKTMSTMIVLVIVLGSLGLMRIDWTEKKGKSLTVSVLQSNISQEVKLDPSSLMPSIALYKEMTEKAKHSELIVWPETGLFDSFERHMDSLIIPLQASLKDTNKAILLGGFFVNDKQGVENSVLALTANDRSIYSKRHLVPFGEYTPLLSYMRWLDRWIQLPYNNVSKGLNTGVLKINDYLAQMTICYEDAFGAEMITSLPQADFLINVTHDGWFTGSLEPYQHMQIARMRSLETGRYMIRSTTNGPAGIIDEKGKLLATAPIYTQHIITHKVESMKGSTPYVRWGNWFIMTVISLILLLGLLFKNNVRET